MTLHDLFTLIILPIETAGTNKIQYMKYISEYILKLQIHQHNSLHGKENYPERQVHHLLDGDIFPRHLSAWKTMVINKLMCGDVPSMRTCQ